MSLREFFDADGIRWKAWDVTANQIHPKTRAEDYMHDLADGWLVFERADGEEKRRLCPYPSDWDERTDEELMALYARADQVRRRSTSPIGMWKFGDASVVSTPHRETTPRSPASDIPRRPKDSQQHERGEEKQQR